MCWPRCGGCEQPPSASRPNCCEKNRVTLFFACDGASMATDPAAAQAAGLRAASRPVVQRQAQGSRQAQLAPEVATKGVEGAGSPLPHLAQIQRSFGDHDVSGVSAHVGGAAADASEALGAQAYATGNDLAFESAPDLHTSAHEAAHVIQQRGGVQLKGGIGQAGDVYEQNADAVADAVVGGRSAAPLLDRFAGRGGSPGTVQRKPQPTGGEKTKNVEASTKDSKDAKEGQSNGPVPAGREEMETVKAEIQAGTMLLEESSSEAKALSIPPELAEMTPKEVAIIERFDALTKKERQNFLMGVNPNTGAFKKLPLELKKALQARIDGLVELQQAQGQSALYKTGKTDKTGKGKGANSVIKGNKQKFGHRDIAKQGRLFFPKFAPPKGRMGKFLASQGARRQEWLGTDAWTRLEAAMRYSALPGLSRHHWGTDVDILSTDPSDWEEKEHLKTLSQWLAKNARKTGIDIVYTEGREGGYQKEAWHLTNAPVARALHARFNAEVDIEKDVIPATVKAFSAWAANKRGFDEKAQKAALESGLLANAEKLKPYRDDINPAVKPEAE